MSLDVPLTIELGACEALDEVDLFARLVREHQSMVFSIAYHALRDPAQAEDIAQEAFLRLAERHRSLASPDHIRFWLRQVTSRLCIDELRRRALRPVASLEGLPEPVAEACPSDLWASEQLRRLVAELPDAARLAIVLRYQEDLDPTEIAQLLKESVHTVKSRLQRALNTLRTRIDTLNGGRRP